MTLSVSPTAKSCFKTLIHKKCFNPCLLPPPHSKELFQRVASEVQSIASKSWIKPRRRLNELPERVVSKRCFKELIESRNFKKTLRVASNFESMSAFRNPNTTAKSCSKKLLQLDKALLERVASKHVCFPQSKELLQRVASKHACFPKGKGLLQRVASKRRIASKGK